MKNKKIDLSFLVIWLVITIILFFIFTVFHKKYELPYSEESYRYLESVAQEIESGNISLLALPDGISKSDLSTIEGNKIKLVYFEEYIGREITNSDVVYAFLNPYNTDDEMLYVTFDKSGKIINTERWIKNREQKTKIQKRIMIFTSVFYGLFLAAVCKSIILIISLMKFKTK